MNYFMNIFKTKFNIYNDVYILDIKFSRVRAGLD